MHLRWHTCAVWNLSQTHCICYQLTDTVLKELFVVSTFEMIRLQQVQSQSGLTTILLHFREHHRAAKLGSYDSDNNYVLGQQSIVADALSNVSFVKETVHFGLPWPTCCYVDVRSRSFRTL